MILIADSGSTKTDWCAAETGKTIRQIQTSGMNPFFQTPEEMEKVFEEALLPFLPEGPVEEVCFYGAGCIPEKIPVVRTILEKTLKIPAKVESDLLGAARALCGREPGIACILGTGSNSCFYDGNSIVENVSPLGYILGDEGGGAALGKCLIREYLRGNLSPACESAFYEKYRMRKEEILDRVYKQPFANRFLAGFASFLPGWMEGAVEPRLRRTIRNCFTDFFKNCIKHYDYENYPVNAIGSVAWYFREMIGEAAEEEGVTLGKIDRSPMEGLVAYHAG